MNFRTLLKCSLPCLIAAFTFSAFAAVDPPYEVGTWGDFAQGAVTFTFDDNTPNQLSVAQPLFDEKGFHMTMFVVINWGPNYTEYKKAVAKGHEIGSHSVKHGNPMPADEAKPSQDSIKKNIPGEMCVSIGYPNCTQPDENTLKKYYIVGRICNGSANGKTPSFFKISSTICGSQGVNSVKGFTDLADQAASSKGWNVYLMHGVDTEPQGSSDYSPTTSTTIKGALDYLDKNRSKVWVETMGNVARYIKERDAVSVTRKDSTDKGIVISVTDNLADSIFNYPLSIRRPLPDGWTTAVVTQKGKLVDDTIITSGSTKYIMFKAVPDSGDVLISQSATEVKNRRFGFNGGSLSPVNLRQGTLLVDAGQFNNSSMHVTLFDMGGKVLVSRSLAGSEAGIALPQFTVSTFIAKVSGGGRSWSGTFVLRM